MKTTVFPHLVTNSTTEVVLKGRTKTTTYGFPTRSETRTFVHPTRIDWTPSNQQFAESCVILRNWLRQGVPCAFVEL
jgi:hypothetical protein